MGDLSILHIYLFIQSIIYISKNLGILIYSLGDITNIYFIYFVAQLFQLWPLGSLPLTSYPFDIHLPVWGMFLSTFLLYGTHKTLLSLSIFPVPVPESDVSPKNCIKKKKRISIRNQNFSAQCVHCYQGITAVSPLSLPSQEIYILQRSIA